MYKKQRRRWMGDADPWADAVTPTPTDQIAANVAAIKSAQTSSMFGGLVSAFTNAVKNLAVDQGGVQAAPPTATIMGIPTGSLVKYALIGGAAYWLLLRKK